MNNQPLIVVDSNFLAHQAYYAMKKAFGERPTTAVVFGFLLQVLAVADFFKSNRFVFCWDSLKSRRERLLPCYKQHRREFLTEEEILEKRQRNEQMQNLRLHVLGCIGFRNVFHADGFEGDDLVAQVARYERGSNNVIIVSNDHDLYQVLANGVRIWNLRQMMTYNKFVEEYGLLPKQWTMVKQMAGCDGDNVPGIPGIGETSAIKYLKGELSGARKASILSASGQQIIRRNLALVSLPMQGTPVFTLTKDAFSWEGLTQVCQEFDMPSLLDQRRWETFFDGSIGNVKADIRKAMEGASK